ncbi:MAG: M28 family peptidase [Bacteroidota bacterium]|nr:M28 family peptidase [Bacteroidota bacterium]
MADSQSFGWQKMLDGYPWFRCEGCYPVAAYSEFMPSPLVGRKPLGEIDHVVFSDDDPFGWHITEREEEYELRPGIEHTGQQIMSNIIKLGKGFPENHIHGHGGANLKDNPYWPPELALKAGVLSHERFVTLLPLMLSRTQDDKGRVIWSLFGNSIHDPETLFWKNFYKSPGVEIAPEKSISFFTDILADAYNEKCTDSKTLLDSGFRILTSEVEIPEWTKPFVINENSTLDKVRYLLTFRPFSELSSSIRKLYLSGKLSLIPFPGSLVFWGMPGYEKLKKEFPLARQIPLLNLVARNRGIDGLKVAQAGWIHEPRPGIEHKFNEELISDTFHRTHRWQRLHRYQDELNEVAHKVKLIKVLFSTEPDAMGLYDKPLARNSHIWDDRFELLLDGPNSDRKKIMEAEKTILEGGLFGYRFFYPPMRAGEYEVYLHLPLIGYLQAGSDEVRIRTDQLNGYMTGYHRKDEDMSHPVGMWPRFLRREIYLSAIKDFENELDHFSHQTSLNILSLLYAWEVQNRKPLSGSYARSLLNIAKQKSLQLWLDELPLHSSTKEAGTKMREALLEIIESAKVPDLPEAITFSETATRHFEENWWNDISYLAFGNFINKDNADVAQDNATLALIRKKQRDLDSLGDYLLSRHRRAIADAGMEGIAICGELPFKWQTDFEFPMFGGWTGNQKDEIHERNILVVIPGKNRKHAVVFGDHYDTAYMEDIYETDRGGSGARLSANGADDNYSASSTLLQAVPIFLRLSKEGRLERDIWILHLTGEEFPSDCMGARQFGQSLVEKNIRLKTGNETFTDISGTEIAGVFIMDMIGHNRDNDQDIFQISPGNSAASQYLAWQAHKVNQIWNNDILKWNTDPERRERGRGKRITGSENIPAIARFLHLEGEVRTKHNPYSSLFNTDAQIFSDLGVPVVLFMENYDINRSGYHDTKDTLENIDLDYGAALAAIAIETVAQIACQHSIGF